MMPMGPAPVISTSSPKTGKDRAVWTALPKGSKMAAMSRSTVGSCRQMLLMGRAMYSANAPGRFTPTPWVCAHKMTPTRQAIAAAAADDMPLSTDDFARVKIVHVGTNFDNFADEFVADGQGTGMVRCAHSSHS